MRLHDYLDYRARLQPDVEFAVMGDRRVSYREALGQANRLANAFVAAGLDVGDRVAVLAKNSIELALLYYGASKAGVALVPLNYRLAPPEWAYIANDAEAKLLIARGDLASALEPARAELPQVKRWIAIDAEGPGWESWEGFLDGQPTTRPDREIPEDCDVYQMYTSGTTGRPKGAMLTHRSVCANIYQGALVIGGDSGERSLIVAPLYHAAAAMTSFASIQFGGTLYLQEDFNPAEVVRALSEEQIAMTMLVPAMIQACLVFVPGVAERRYDDLRLIVYGASPIAEETLRKSIDVFDCDFLQGYGMTETTAALTYLLPEDHRAALAGNPRLLLSAGRPLIGTEVRIVDQDDRPLGPDEVGEIVGRGPQIMRGYWNMPEATKEALRGGWMHTGDAALIDAAGYVFIQDRVKDMIVSGGENVYPREIEDVLFQHPALADAAVIGVPDEKWGEAVKAIVVLKQGETATAKDIISFCKGRLGGYKQPRSVDFVDALPRNPTGKVLKKDLREKYWAGHTRRVAGS